MKKWNIRGNVLRKWLLSYLLVLLAPLVGTVLTYTYTHQTLAREVAAANRQTLSGVMTGVDDAFRQMVYTAESLATNTYFKNAMNAQADTKKLIAADTLSRLTGQIASYERPLNGAEILAYLPQPDYLITKGTANSRALLAESVRVMRNQDLSEGFFPGIEEPYYGGAFLYSGCYSYNMYGRGNVVYLRSIRTGFGQPGARYATVVVNMAADRLLSQFGEMEGRVLLVFDPDDRLLFSAGEDAGRLLDSSLHESDSDGMVSYQTGEQLYLGYRTRSALSGWTFVLLSQEARFWKSARYIAAICLSMLGTALLTGLLLTFFLLRMNYRPVRETLNSVAPKGVPSGKNEFEVIQQSYTDLLSRHTDIRRKLAIQQEALVGNYLFSHLHGSRETLTGADFMSFLQLDLTGKSFVIISFMLAEGQQPSIDPRLAEAAGDQDAASFLIDSLFARVFIDRYVGYRIPCDQLYTWLMVLSPGQEEDFLEIAAEKLEGMLDRLKNTLSVPVSALLSEVVASFDALPNAYQDIEDFSKYQCAVGGQGVVRVSSYKRRVERQDMRRREDEELELLCDAICARRPGDACAVVSRMLERLRAQAKGSAWLERMRVCGWICLLLDTEEIMDHADHAAVEKLLLAVSRAGSLDETGEHFLALIRVLCGEIQTPARDDGSRLSRRLQDYIDQHYTDPNLSLFELGEVFGLTPKYLSRLYRSETDGSLLEYLNTVRVHAARKLLESREATIEEAAERVGYTSVRTFRRAFLRIEGITPGQAGGMDSLDEQLETLSDALGIPIYPPK